MLTEFPTVAELLALAVGAGEGAVGALDRVCRLSHGELAGELRRCLADARAGANLPTALQGLADRTGLPSLRRFVDGVVIAVQRGTPLAEVLRAQAQDVREEGRRALMEAGGRKEIAMMVPVVFLILPVTVLFAVFPGFHLLPLHPLTTGRTDRCRSSAPCPHPPHPGDPTAALEGPRDGPSAVTCPAGCSSR